MLPRRHRTIGSVVRLAIVLGTAAAVAVGASGCSGGAPVAVGSPAATHRIPPPDPDPTSPATPAGLPTAPSPIVSPPAVEPEADGPTTVPTGPAAATPFCATAAAEAVRISRGGLTVLRAVATSGTEAGPQIRDAVEQIRADVAALAAAAPGAVRDAALVLRQAWDDLVVAAQGTGWSPSGLVALGVKHLTTREVTAAWSSLTRYVSGQCGVDLGAQVI